MYKYWVARRAPISLWLLDGNTAELSGRTSATQHGAPGSHPPLVSGLTASSVVSESNYYSVSSFQFKRGMEERPFVLEAWVVPLVTGDQAILCHPGTLDGLSISGSVIKFQTSYLTSGSATCTFDFGTSKLLHVVGIHSADKNQLWVNGVLVASVPLTDDQKGDTYLPSSTTLNIGGAVGAEIAVSAVSVYASLSGDQIVQNYQAGISGRPQTIIANQFGATLISLASESNSVFYSVDITDKGGFSNGISSGVQIDTARIVPQIIEGVSQPGSWTMAVPLDIGKDSSIYGVYVSWYGNNVLVEGSLNGTSWTALTNSSLVSIIPNGYNPTNKDLQIRAQFAGGFVDGEEFLENISVICLRNAKIVNPTTRSITVSHPAVPRGDFEPFLFNDLNGIALGGGSLTIGPDSAPLINPVKGVELWIKRTGALSINLSGTQYINGVLGATLPLNSWSHVVFTDTNDIGSNIVISGQGIIGQVNLYPSTLGLSDVSKLYLDCFQSYFDIIFDTSTILVSEVPTSVRIYAHDWSISASG